MKRATTWVAACGVLVSATVALAVWNPFGWTAADRVVDRARHAVGIAAAAADAGGGDLYTCSMHPQVLQHGPGDCPICNMDLVPAAPAAVPADDDLYTCSMHPDVLRHEPGDCPICRMALVPVDAGEAAAAGADAGGGDHVHLQHAPAGAAARARRPPDLQDGPRVETGEPGPAAAPGVHVSSGFLQSFGVRTAPVERGSLPVAIRTVGTLAHNERNVFSVNTKFSGWIERARVNNVGEQVAAGELLFEIYSPDLVTTQHEYLTAMDYVARLRERGAHEGALEQAASLLDAARERLLYADMTARQIETLEATRRISRTVEFVSPASGFIVEKMSDSLEGMRLDPGMTVLKIADHSTLWVEVEFYERDVRHLRGGQRVAVTVDAFPGRRWDGAIAFFRPAMNPGTRTLTAFVEVENADLRLRPRMFATVEANAPGAADALMVPADAVLHDGDQAVVVVARGDGYCTPREVRLGLASAGRQEIIDGLDGGEEIVVSSQFLIDSESNLKAAIAQLLGERTRADAPR